MVDSGKEETLSSVILDHLNSVTKGTSDRNSIAKATGESDQALALVLGKLWKRHLIKRHSTLQGWKFYWSRNNASVDLVPDEWPDPEILAAEKARKKDAKDAKDVKNSSLAVPDKDAELDELAKRVARFSPECEKPEFGCSLTSKYELQLGWGGELKVSLNPGETFTLIDFLFGFPKLAEKLREVLATKETTPPI